MDSATAAEVTRRPEVNVPGGNGGTNMCRDLCADRGEAMWQVTPRGERGWEHSAGQVETWQSSLCRASGWKCFLTKRLPSESSQAVTSAVRSIKPQSWGDTPRHVACMAANFQLYFLFFVRASLGYEGRGPVVQSAQKPLFRFWDSFKFISEFDLENISVTYFLVCEKFLQWKKKRIIEPCYDSTEFRVQKRNLCEIKKFLDNPDHPLCIFNQRLLQSRCNTDRYRRSFLPTAITIYKWCKY